MMPTLLKLDPFLAAWLSIAATTPAMASDFLLYDGTLKTTVAEQGWLRELTSEDAQDAITTSDHVRLNTTVYDNDKYNRFLAGISNYNRDGKPVNDSLPEIDRAEGFTLQFSVRLNSEAHEDDDDAANAGFNVILLASDRRGIQLSFRNREVFAQNDSEGGGLFSKGEATNFDMAELHSFVLTVVGEEYWLGEGDRTILKGHLREYRPEEASSDFAAMYSLSNFIYLGDNMSSARADTDIYSVSASFPEPGAAAFFGFAIVTCSRRRSRNAFR